MAMGFYYSLMRDKPWTILIVGEGGKRERSRVWGNEGERVKKEERKICNDKGRFVGGCNSL